MVAEKGWLSRVKGSFVAAILGVGFLLASFALLFWNEGRAVRRAQDLDYGLENTVSAAADSIDTKNEGKLIHISGDGTATGLAVDPVFWS